MNQAKRGGRFSYLPGAAESTQTPAPTAEESTREHDSGSSLVERKGSLTRTNNSGGGEEGRSLSATRDELASIPKGKGRMKQQRSQLNVRLPTKLKRQAAAKAVLEGKDIGEVIEELLREYLAR